MSGKSLSLAVLAAGLVLALAGGGAAVLARPDAQLAANEATDPNTVYGSDPWPGRVILGGEAAAVLGLIGVAVGLNGWVRAASRARRGS